MREEPKVYTCGYYSLDEPQNMLKDLFSWDADLSVLSANNESEWGNWGTIYENGQLLLYMGGIGLMKDCAFQGLTPMGDGMSAFRVEQGIEGFDLPGEITLYLEDADNSYGCRIVGCEITKTS